MLKKQIILILSLLSLIALQATAAPVLVEAEAFENKGGWVVDAQFMDHMGSPFLLAHGLGHPVTPARTTVLLPDTGDYRVYVRTRDWVAPQGPGQFAITVDGVRLDKTFGLGGSGEWEWWDGGIITLSNSSVTVSLIDLTGCEARCDALLFVPASEAATYQPPESSDFGWRRSLLGLPRDAPIAGAYDFVVVGGGYAGMCAAVAAARLGVRTALIQNRPVLGGNASSEIRVCPIGKPGMPPYPRNSDILYEIHQISDVIPDASYQRPPANEVALEKWIRAEANLELYLNMHVYAVETNGSRIVAVMARHTQTAVELRFDGQIFADCTGDGAVGFLAGAEYRQGSESREESGESLARSSGKPRYLGATNYWRTRWTEYDSAFPECPWAVNMTPQSLHVSALGYDPRKTSGVPYPVYWNWESGFEWDQVAHAEHIRDHNFRAMYGAWDYLKNRGPQKERYRKAELYWSAYVTGKRESRRLLGDYILEQDDLIEHRLYDDGVVTTTWYIDLHFPHPENTRDFPGEEFRSVAYDDPKVKELLPDQPNQVIKIKPYPIPYRCFYSRNVDNLFMAGRDISGTHVALASPRVMNTTAQMGAMVGRATSLCIKHGCQPRDIYHRHLAELKALLMNPGAQSALSLKGELVFQGRDTWLGNLKWHIRQHSGMPNKQLAVWLAALCGILAAVVWVLILARAKSTSAAAR